jgi:hypothetical protein
MTGSSPRHKNCVVPVADALCRFTGTVAHRAAQGVSGTGFGTACAAIERLRTSKGMYLCQHSCAAYFIGTTGHTPPPM